MSIIDLVNNTHLTEDKTHPISEHRLWTSAAKTNPIIADRILLRVLKKKYCNIFGEIQKFSQSYKHKCQLNDEKDIQSYTFDNTSALQIMAWSTDQTKIAVSYTTFHNTKDPFCQTTTVHVAIVNLIDHSHKVFEVRNQPSCASFNADGSNIAIGFYNKIDFTKKIDNSHMKFRYSIDQASIKKYDTKTGTLLATIAEYEQPKNYQPGIKTIIWSRCVDMLSNDAESIKWWDDEEKNHKTKSEKNDGKISVIALSKDGYHRAYGYTDNTLRVVDASGADTTEDTVDINNPIIALTFNKNNTQLAIASCNKNKVICQVLDLDTLEMSTTAHIDQSDLLSMSWLDDSSSIVLLFKDGTTYLWDTKKKIPELYGNHDTMHKNSDDTYNNKSLSPCGNYTALVSKDNILKIKPVCATWHDAFELIKI